jgi:hypothetical protein
MRVMSRWYLDGHTQIELSDVQLDGSSTPIASACASARRQTLSPPSDGAVAEIAEGEPVVVLAKHACVERSTVYRWIERYLAERAPCSLADGKRSGRSRMTPALTHAVQQILARVPVAAHLATYLTRLRGFGPGKRDIGPDTVR